MKHLMICLLLAFGLMAVSTIDAGAVVCARGVYRAGCVGPRGAVVIGAPRVHRAVVVAPRRATVVHRRVYYRRRY